MPLSPGQRLGTYEIIAPLGAGGMGQVFRARDTQLGREVAIKVLPEAAGPDAVRRLLGEAKAASALNHPNILVVHGVGEHEGAPYIVTELVEGHTLRKIAAAGPVPIDVALDIAWQTMSGLAKAHDAGLVHRDLKPENLMWTGDGIVKILDFGLAKRTAGGAAANLVDSLGTDPTATGLVMGTAAYMSPEQARGQRADERSDLFAFGVVLYELLTGVHPFRRATLADTVSAVLRDTPPPVAQVRSGIPPAFAALVMRLLEKDPAERPASARVVERELALGTGSGARPGRLTRGSSGALGVAASGATRGRRMQAAIAVVALVVVGAVGGGVWLQAQRRAAPLPGLFAPGTPVVAVMSIDNKTTDADLVQSDVGRVLSDAFVQILYDCQGLQVVSPVRIQSLVMGRKRTFADTGRDFNFAQDICRRASANGMLAGSLSQIGANFVLDATLTDLATGKLRGKFSAHADGKEKLLDALTSELALEVKQALSAGNAPELSPIRPVSEMTTHSYDAYVHYARGQDFNGVGEFDSARPELEEAVRLDPEMGIAWSELSCAYSFLGDRALAEAANRRAHEMRDHMNRRERMWADANSLWVEGEHGEKDRAAIEQYVHEFPDDRQAFFYAGLAYEFLDKDCASATRQFEKAYALTPEYYPITKGLADCAKESGDTAGARRILERYLRVVKSGAGASQARGYMQGLRGAQG